MNRLKFSAISKLVSFIENWNGHLCSIPIAGAPYLDRKIQKKIQQLIASIENEVVTNAENINSIESLELVRESTSRYILRITEALSAKRFQREVFLKSNTGWMLRQDFDPQFDLTLDYLFDFVQSVPNVLNNLLNTHFDTIVFTTSETRIMQTDYLKLRVRAIKTPFTLKAWRAIIYTL